MGNRIDLFQTSPEAIQALMTTESYLEKSSLGPKILGLVKLRASQLNGCAFCVNMHYGELKKSGFPDTLINLVSVWREASCFSDKERAALGWTETVTLLANHHISDQNYDLVTKYFSDKELVDLTVAIGQINLWNRLAVSFRPKLQVEH